MIVLGAGDIENATGAVLERGNRESTVKGVSIDSRKTAPGDLFVAVKGSRFDGHAFVGEALERGAAGIMVTRSGNVKKSGSGPFELVVDDTQRALGDLAACIRKKVNIPVICITGTNGKTTVKDILSHILSSRYKVLKSRASYNNIIGLSLTLFELTKNHEVAVLELGTSKPGEISRLAAIAQPHVAVVNNIGDGHLQAFSDREGVFMEKMSLIDALPETGMAFLNNDDPLLSRAEIRDVTVRRFGSSPKIHFRIEDINVQDHTQRFSLNGEGYSISLEGLHNVHNAAAAVSVALQFDMDSEDIRTVISGAKGPAMRMEKVVLGDITFIKDCYNANPDSFESALNSLEIGCSSRIRVVVAGDMLDLGQKSDEFHRAVGKSIAYRNLDFIVTLGERSRLMAEGAREAGMSPDNIFRADDHRHAAEILKNPSMSGATVLLKGSRAMKMEEILKCYTTCCTP
ncbi:MAG: UDP-N-acetylmuramoyl-tripeptide--D-alanyl-D-alanine ligase [Candidatus Omnitrophica bacterium]|nr:UDP-N-acetylmuramoyl-tripeptide--D-alanyl-D-alanine ligase [Candidatus Omnitrophota bacterium]